MMFGAYFVIAVVIGHLATQLHEREQAERRREERATALYRLTRDAGRQPRSQSSAPESFTVDQRFLSGGCGSLVAR